MTVVPFDNQHCTKTHYANWNVGSTMILTESCAVVFDIVRDSV